MFIVNIMDNIYLIIITIIAHTVQRLSFIIE